MSQDCPGPGGDAVAVGHGFALSIEPSFIAIRNISAAVVGGFHPFADNSAYDVPGGTGAAASFDSLPNIVGTYNYQHFAGLQFRPIAQTTGTIDNIYGHLDLPTVNGGAIVTARYGVEIWDTQVISGTLTTQYGVHVKELTAAGTNWAIKTDGATPSSFGGPVTISGKLTLSASSTSRASLNIAAGTAPTSPNDGDMWFDGTNLKIRVGGSTKTVTLT